MPTRRRTQEPRRTIVRRTIIEEEPEVEKPSVQNWIRKNPVAAIGLGVLLLIVLFAPIFSATKTVETTETVMVPVTTDKVVPGTTGTKTIAVYQGYIYDLYDDVWQIDPVAAVVEVKKTRGIADTWVYTTIDYYGNQVIYRNVVDSDLTKTGTTTVEATTAAGTQAVTQQVPQQVTREKEIQVRVNLIQWLFGGY